MMNNIISLSGGKDSTAMLLMMLDRKEPIHSAVFFDTGWEFPEMHDHIKRLSSVVWDKYKVKVWTLYPRLPFEFMMVNKPIISKKGPEKGKVHRIGNGWPSPFRRWCTRHKVDQIEHYQKSFQGIVSCIGYGSDESHRVKGVGKIEKRYPLIEWGITEKDALEYCYDKGFDWGGLYELFGRVSCFCCPLKRIGDYRKLRQHRPELWGRMLKMDNDLGDNRGFLGFKTVHDLDRRFAEEDRQMTMFEKSA